METNLFKEGISLESKYKIIVINKRYRVDKNRISTVCEFVSPRLYANIGYECLVHFSKGEKLSYILAITLALFKLCALQ